MKIKGFLGLAAVGLTVGVTVVPGVLAQSTQTTSTEVEVVVDDTLQIASSGKVTINVMPSSAGTLATGVDNVKVSTNGGKGYSLSIRDADTDLALNPPAGTTSPTPIAASVNAWNASGNVTPLDVDSWGYRVEGSAEFGAVGYVGVTTIDQVVKSTTADAVDDLTKVTFGVNLTPATSDGTYTDVVTYTAVNNT
jgi:hypothetical protein